MPFRPFVPLVAAAVCMLAPGIAEAQATAGAQALLRGEYDEAVRSTRSAARDGDADALRVLSLALRETGDYDEAIDVARRGTDAGVSGAGALLGQLLREVGRIDEARAVLDAAAGQPGAGGAEARLQQGILAYEYGDRSRAFEIFDGFIDYYNSANRLSANELRAVGEALTYLSRRNFELAHDALRALDEAVAAGPGDHRARIAVGNLFVERYDAAQASEAFREVLAENQSHPEALYGLARVAELEGSGDITGVIATALETNENLVGARTLLARVHLRGGDAASAREELDAALAFNPAFLPGLATLAAVEHVTGRTAAYREVMARIRDTTSNLAETYAMLAEISGDHRKYQDAAAFAQEAVRDDEIAWPGWGLLGINQVRLGQVDQGRVNLEKAFAGDPFNVWFKNTLDLLDTFVEYRIVESDNFQFVLHQSEADLLEPYIGPIAERAFEEMSARYGYRPLEPIRVEMYPDHADFSVRTVGLVGMGALGVSFGPALAMDSPSARGMGEFNWASTLWHEIAHSFHLGATEHEVPRWFSEGLAVHEQRKAANGWGHQASPSFIQSLASGGLRPASELDKGFSHPRHPGEVIHSYYEASLVFELIEDRYGFDAIVEMMAAYRDGASNAAAFERALGVSLEDFDETFDAYLKERFAAPLAAFDTEAPDLMAMMGGGDLASAREAVVQAPNRFLPRLRLGVALFNAGQLDEAATHFETAARMFPGYGGPDGPHWYLGQIRREQGDLVAAEDHLRQLLAVHESHYHGRKALGELLEEVGQREEAATVLAEIAYIHPYVIEDRRHLAGLYEQLSDHEGAVRERRAVVALRPVDMASAHYQLARAHLSAGDRAAARSQVLAALEIAPNFEDALDLLLELRGGTR